MLFLVKEKIVVVFRKEFAMKEYKKPVLKMQKKNTFVFEALKTHVKGAVTCNQCSSCHGCRG